MSLATNTSIFSVVGLALLAGAGVAYAASPVQGFGPLVNGDKSLNASLGKLAHVIAWQNSPEGDVYQLALAMPVPDAPFEDAAIEAETVNSLDARPAVHNDQSLNASLDVLAKVMVWQTSPGGNAFQFALEDHLKGSDFRTIALASVPPNGFRSVLD